MPLRHNAATFCALLVGLLVTTVATAYVHRAIMERRQRRFEDAVTEGTARIQQRMDTHQAALLGVRALFASSHQVEPGEFHQYVHSLELAERNPGLQGIGYAPWTEGRAPLLYMEPLGAAAPLPLGTDLMSEPTRREALERARDTGEPTASGPMPPFLGDDDSGDAHFDLVVPFYVPPTPTTLEARRNTLRGFIYAPFHARELVQALRFPVPTAGSPAMDIHDGTAANAGPLIFQSSPRPPPPHTSRMERVVTVDISGRPWTLRFTAPSSYSGLGARSQQWVVLGSGLLLTLLLCLVTRAQARAQARAEAATAEQRRLAQAAESAVHLRDEFLGIAAHELRTPLTSLQLQLQLLQRQLGPGASLDTERVARGVASCARQTARLSQLMDSLLDLSRITRGRMELQLESLDLGEVVRELTRRFEAEAQGTDVRLTVRASPGVRGHWDRLRLEQVVTNLLSNALKYGHGAPVDVRVDSDGAHAWLEVEDRGIGIAPEDAPRIFERFERAVSSRHYGGLGLGLFITRQLVEALGGHISVASTPGRGSTFTVTLPLAGPPRGPDVHVPPDAPLS
ncbi:histidine kinase [Corallococcus sp. H22C18031201]|nr:histidine kinase [Corallococcus sp. H22C18031201]